MKISCSIIERSWPPYSSGQPMPEPAVGAELPDHAPCRRPPRRTRRSRTREPGLDLRRDQVGEVASASSSCEAAHAARARGRCAWRKTITCSSLESRAATCLVRPPMTEARDERRPRDARTAARRRSGSRAAGTASGLESTFRDGKPHARRGVRRQARRLGRHAGQPQRPRRLLPAHGRRPHPGHGQGRRDRLPVPRLALGRRRQVQVDPLRPAGPAARPHPEVPRRRSATAS